MNARPRLRGVLHAVAALLSVVALVWLVRSAETTQARVAAWIYGIAAILCYLTSSTYHMGRWGTRAKAAFRRADHAMIYVLIAGTFSPVCMLAMAGWWRWVVVGVVWAGAVLGVALSIPSRPRMPRFGIALYLILGWAGLLALPALLRHPGRAALVITAGILYTVGAILFGRRQPTLQPSWFGYHEFWHALGVAAGALLFAVNLGLIAGTGTAS